MWIDLDLVGFPSCGYAKIVQWWRELFILRKVVSSVRNTCMVLYGEERPGDGIESGDGIEQKPDKSIGRHLHETAHLVLDPSSGNYGCVVSAGVWHTVEVLEPSVIYEAKDGKYGEDGSEAV